MNREEAKSENGDVGFEVAYLQTEFLRDACLVDAEFYDDYFRYPPGGDKKKSRPYLVFTHEGKGTLFVPLRNRSADSKYLSDWKIKLGEPYYDGAVKQNRQATVELSKAFWAGNSGTEISLTWIVGSWGIVANLGEAEVIQKECKKLAVQVHE